MPAQLIVLRKKKNVRKLLIDRAGGQVRFDRCLVPDSALTISGIKAVGQHIALVTTDIKTLIYYYGVNTKVKLTDADVMNLVTGNYTSSKADFQVDAVENQYIYFANPSSLSDPYFVYQGMQGGFLDMGTVNLQFPTGLQTYRVWRSRNSDLGLAAAITAQH